MIRVGKQTTVPGAKVTIKILSVFLVLFGYAEQGIALTDADFAAITAKAVGIEKLRGIDVVVAEKNFVTGTHVLFSFYNLISTPNIAVLIRPDLVGFKKSNSKEKPKTRHVVSVQPDKSPIDFQTYNKDLSDFTAFKPQFLEISDFKAQNMKGIALKYSDENRVIRYVRWIEVPKNKMVMLALYNEKGIPLSYDIKFDGTSDIPKEVKSGKNLFFSDFPLNFFSQDIQGGKMDLLNIEEARGLSVRLLDHIKEIGHGR